MCEVYKIFASDWECDFSNQAMQDMFLFESKGVGNIDITGFNTTGKKSNGYAVGKKWLNVSVAAWIKDISIFLPVATNYYIYNDEDPIEQQDKIPVTSVKYIENKCYRGWFNVLSELYSNNKFPHWWLDEVFFEFIKNKKEEYENLGLIMDMSFKNTVA